MMKTTLLFAGCFLLCGQFSYAQNVYEACGLPKSAYSDFYTVDVEQARCLARHSDKERTIFYCYNMCGAQEGVLPAVIHLSKEYDTDLYLLLTEEEKLTHYFFKPVAAMLDTVYHNTLKAVIITDSLYSPKAFKSLQAPIRKIIDIRGKKASEKFYRFNQSVNPEGEYYASLIVMNKQGETLGSFVWDYERRDSPYKGYDEAVELLK